MIDEHWPLLVNIKCPNEDCNGWLEYQKEVRFGYKKFKCHACGAIEIKE